MKKVLLIVVGVMLVVSSAFAANGDLVVNGQITTGGGVTFPDSSTQTTTSFGTEYFVSGPTVTITALLTGIIYPGALGTPIVSQSLGTVTAGQRFLVLAQSSYGQSGSNAGNFIQIQKSGTATIQWARSGTTLYPEGFDIPWPGTLQAGTGGMGYMTAQILKITGSGTLTLAVGAAHTGGTTIAFGCMYIVRLK